MAGQGYEDIFGQRAHPYDQAMQRYPHARAQEFQHAVRVAALSTGMRVGDVPAGGGYLKPYLPDDCDWHPHEPCLDFHLEQDVAASNLLPFPWESDYLDRVISIAGVHHLSDKKPLFEEVFRVLKPGGQFILLDVAADSAVARFLDGFVGAHNSTGHAGVYLNENSLSELSASGFTILSHGQLNYTWDFPSRQAMSDFAIQLFDLKGVEAPLVEAAIEQHFGLQEYTEGGVSMNWSLMQVTACKV